MLACILVARDALSRQQTTRAADVFCSFHERGNGLLALASKGVIEYKKN